jgi:hypothetical protein
MLIPIYVCIYIIYICIYRYIYIHTRTNTHMHARTHTHTHTHTHIHIYTHICIIFLSFLPRLCHCVAMLIARCLYTALRSHTAHACERKSEREREMQERVRACVRLEEEESIYSYSIILSGPRAVSRVLGKKIAVLGVFN